MNFLYLYPCYSEARKAWENKCHELQKIQTGSFSYCPLNLSINNGTDYHKFNYVPIRVHVDLERLGMVVSVLHLQPLIEDLIDRVKKELIKLNDYAISATGMEHERARSNPSPKLQTPDAPTPGGTADSSTTELGSKTISGDAILQGRFDF